MKHSRNKDYWLKCSVWGIAYFLGLVFLVAGVSKLFIFPRIVHTVGIYGIFSKEWIPALVAVLIGVEIISGALFFIKRYQGLAAGLACVLLTGFIALAVYSRALGIKADCGCFGFVRSQMASVEHLVLDGVLLILSMTVLFLTADDRQ